MAKVRVLGRSLASAYERLRCDRLRDSDAQRAVFVLRICCTEEPELAGKPRKMAENHATNCDMTIAARHGAIEKYCLF